MSTRTMNHYGYRDVSAEVQGWAIPRITASTNIANRERTVDIRLYGKRGGNRYDQTILGLPLDEAEDFAFGLIWLVNQVRGAKLDTTAQQVECGHGDGPHVGTRFLGPEERS